LGSTQSIARTGEKQHCNYVTENPSGFCTSNIGGCTSLESPHPVDPCSLYRCDIRKRLVITPRSSAENDAVVENLLLRARAARFCHFHSGL
jgi:hypothetical protein